MSITKRQMAQTLRKAAKIVDEKWMQGEYHKDGKFCAIGAVEQASGYRDGGKLVHWEMRSNELDMATEDALTRYLQLRFNAGGVITWNDEEGRTSKEVASAMRGAARWLEHGEVL